MASINVTINGRQFRMACEDGQESHLTKLAADLDRRVEDLRKNFGEIGDTRLTVMAALTVSDELAEVNRRLRRLEAELAAMQDARIASADKDQAKEAAIAAALNGAAERIEGVAKRLTVKRSTDVPMG